MFFSNDIFDHKYVYEEIGYNLKPIELQASMGLVQMEKLEEIGIKRRENYKNLYSAFNKYNQYFHLHEAQLGADVDWFAFPVTVKDDAPFKRSDICKFFESNKIQTRPYFAGNIMLQIFLLQDSACHVSYKYFSGLTIIHIIIKM